jgi:hypothetical protein
MRRSFWTTTVFSTLCYKKYSCARIFLEGQWPIWLLIFSLFSAPSVAFSQTTSTEVVQMNLQRADDGLYLSTQVRFELQSAVEDALLKGIPLVFVVEADMYRDRWYWYDKRVTSASRHWRLAFQPLTKRWRVSLAVGNGQGAGGVTLNQNFDQLGDAVAYLQRNMRWKIADAADIEPDARHSVEFRFRLDLSQLARPFQIGTAGQSEWNINASRVMRLGSEPAGGKDAGKDAAKDNGKDALK